MRNPPTPPLRNALDSNWKQSSTESGAGDEEPDLDEDEAAMEQLHGMITYTVYSPVALPPSYQFFSPGESTIHK